MGEPGETREEPAMDNGGDTEKIYWCDVCRKTFDSKRCPQCGLKLKRVG